MVGDSQASLGNAKNVLVQKQAELEQERKGAAQLCGHELSGLSADELTSIQKTLAEAGQRLLEHQEQLRITAMRNAQVPAAAEVLVLSHLSLLGRSRRICSRTGVCAAFAMWSQSTQC